MYSDTIFLLYFRFLSCSNGVSYISFAYFIPEFFFRRNKITIVRFSNMYICIMTVQTSEIEELFVDIVCLVVCLFVCLMVFNATFNNFSAISWWSVFIGGGYRRTRRKPLTCRKSLTNFIT